MRFDPDKHRAHRTFENAIAAQTPMEEALEHLHLIGDAEGDKLDKLVNGENDD